MKRYYFIIITLLLLICGCSSVKFEAKKIDGGAQIKLCDGSGLRVVFYSPQTVRVTRHNSEGDFNKLSLVVPNQTPNVDVDFSEQPDCIILKSRSMSLKISKDNGNIAFIDSTGNNLLRETDTPEFKPTQYFNDSAFSVVRNFTISSEEALYGLGQNQDGIINYRNAEVMLSQSNINAINPVLVSTAGYGIFWDNYSLSYVKEHNNTLSFSSEMADNIDYYLFAGCNIDEVISQYRNLTGKAPVPARWVMGYWQSKEHYHTQDELLSVAEKYRNLNIPIDVIVQDWNWWQPGKWSCMQFDSTRYPSPALMVDKLHKMNMHCMISVWPCVGRNCDMFNDMDSKGYLYYPVGWADFKYIDAYNHDAMNLYCSYLNKGIKSQGFDAWWIDSTEPDVTNALTKDSHLYEMRRMGRNKLGSFARYLNPYVLCFLDDVYQNWHKDTPERRLSILTRSAFAGIQRTGAITWSGDIGASWEVFQNQVKAGINFCMSGIPYWTFDIGAYLIGSYEGVFTYGAKDPAYIELYTRMFQFAAFCPVFRSHGSDEPREMWCMGDNMPILVKFDNLRYRLMPYIYSLAGDAYINNGSILRGLAMDFPKDKKAQNIGDEYLFGKSFLVCPVVNYIYHVPPQISTLVPGDCFKTSDGKPGVKAVYYKTPDFKNPSKTAVVSNIDAYWYTGRPDYVTDSTYSIEFSGKIIPKETGKYQFQIKSFDSRLIIFNGDTLKVIYEGNEPYYEFLNLEAGKEYDIVCKTVNKQTGAARFRLFWKTPSDFAKEKSVSDRKPVRDVYFPEGCDWFDFFTGQIIKGGQTLSVPAPIETMPLYVKAGSVIPMGDFCQYADQKAGGDLEIRIYPGADGSFSLYEDEGDNFNYQKGQYSQIFFFWNNTSRTLSIERKGSFKGMNASRNISLVLVDTSHGIGIDKTADPTRKIVFNGDKQIINF